MKKQLKSSDGTDLTQGGIVSGLVRFAAPFFLSGLIQQLYNTVDMMFVGRLLGKEASAAIDTGGSLITCILGFFTGLSAGVGVITAHLMIQSRINNMGVDNIAAFTVYFRVESFIYLPILALGQANTTVFSQNIGAGFLERAKAATKTSVFLGVMVTAAISTVLLVGHQWVFGLFTNGPVVAQIGYSIARITFPLYFLYVFLEVFSSAIRGAGKAFPSMLIILANSCLLRVILLELMMRYAPTVVGIAVIYPITWASNSLFLGLYYCFGHWQPSAYTP